MVVVRGGGPWWWSVVVVCGGSGGGEGGGGGGGRGAAGAQPYIGRARNSRTRLRVWGFRVLGFHRVRAKARHKTP